jgi:hypothetical protein
VPAAGAAAAGGGGVAEGREMLRVWVADSSSAQGYPFPPRPQQKQQ